MNVRIVESRLAGSDRAAGRHRADARRGAAADGIMAHAHYADVTLYRRLLRQVQQLSSTVLSTYTGEKLLLTFRPRLFGHVQRLSLAHHDTQGTADSTYRIQYDAMSIQTIAIDGVIPFISAAVTLAGMIYVTARIDWQLALVAL